MLIVGTKEYAIYSWKIGAIENWLGQNSNIGIVLITADLNAL
jgi:hypothetical protein